MHNNQKLLIKTQRMIAKGHKKRRIWFLSSTIQRVRKGTRRLELFRLFQL